MTRQTFPKININLEKIAHNVERLKELYGSAGIGIMGVTKTVCGDPIIANMMVEKGIKFLTDSRITNLKKMNRAGVKAQFVLLRSPSLSEIEATVKYADISVNTELEIIKRLSVCAIKHHTVHKIMLMVEMGDLREGIMPGDLLDVVQEVLTFGGIKLAGIGANFACFGGVKPNQDKMDDLSSLTARVEKKCKIRIPIVSGGNSANYNWFTKTDHVRRINNLRLGESIYLGREPLNRTPIKGLFTDAFTLAAEVIESKMKPTAPYGEIGQDAFGGHPRFRDKGNIRRVILGVGNQDVLVKGLTPIQHVEILGSSSDHIILDARKSNLQVGDIVTFQLNYGALLLAMTSPYMMKNYQYYSSKVTEQFQ